MAECIPRCMSADLLQKLHALAERRRTHLVEMQESGRWARYYSQDDMNAHMKDAVEMAGHWQKMCDTVDAPAVEANPA